MWLLPAVKLLRVSTLPDWAAQWTGSHPLLTEGSNSLFDSQTFIPCKGLTCFNLCWARENLWGCHLAPWVYFRSFKTQYASYASYQELASTNGRGAHLEHLGLHSSAPNSLAPKRSGLLQEFENSKWFLTVSNAPMDWQGMHGLFIQQAGVNKVRRLHFAIAQVKRRCHSVQMKNSKSGQGTLKEWKTSSPFSFFSPGCRDGLGGPVARGPEQHGAAALVADVDPGADLQLRVDLVPSPRLTKEKKKWNGKKRVFLLLIFLQQLKALGS